MAGVYGLLSCGGAPGVSSLAAAWPLAAGSVSSPVLVIEATLEGGSTMLAGLFAASVRQSVSLLDLASPVTGLSATDQLLVSSIPLREDAEWLRVVPAVPAAWQVEAISRDVWTAIGRAVRELASRGYTVVIDFGRYRPPTRAVGAVSMTQLPLLFACDAVAVLTPATLAGVNTARNGAAALRTELNELEGSALTRVCAVLAEQPSGIPSYGTKEMAGLLAPVPVVASLSYDLKWGSWFGHGTQPVRPRTADSLLQHARTVTSSIENHAAGYRAQLAGADA